MKLNKIILLSIFLLSLFIRLFRLESSPPSIYWDEASIGYEAYSISQTGKDMHGNSWFQAIFPGYGDYKAPVYIWLTSIVIKILGPTVSAIRIPSAVFGALSVLAIYMLTLKLFKKDSIALGAATTLAFLPGHIQFSRAGFESNVALFFIILFLLFLQLGLKKKKYIIWASLPAIIAMYTYFSARIIIPLIFLVWIVSNIKHFKRVFIPIMLFTTICVIGYVPVYTSPHYQNSNILRLSTDNISNNHQQIVYSNSLRAEDGNTLVSRILHHRLTYTTKQFLLNMSDHFSPSYLFFSGDPNPRHSTGFSGVYLPVSIPLFGLGIFLLLKTKKHSLYILGIWLMFLVPASIPNQTPHLLRSLGSLIPLSIILGIGLDKVMMTIMSKGCKSKVIPILFLTLLFINFSAFYYFLQTQYPKEANQSWQDGYPQLAEYLNQNLDQYDQVLIPPGDRLFLYVLYFSRFPPEQIQAIQAQKLKSNPTDFSINKFGNIEFAAYDLINLIPTQENTLIIASTKDFPKTFKIKDTILDINQKPIFYSLELKGNHED